MKPTPENDTIKSLTDGRSQDLYIGAVEALDDYTRKKINVPIFTVVVHNAKFFQAIKENLADVPQNNGWEIVIGPDAKSLERAIADKMIHLGEFRQTYSVRVQTKATAPVEFFQEDLTPLGQDRKDDAAEGARSEVKSLLPAKTVEVPVYMFQSDKFDGPSVEKFVAALMETRFWLLTIVCANPGGGWMDAPSELRFQSQMSAVSLAPKKSRRERRRRDK